MRVLILGGTRFTGRKLVESLLPLNLELVLLSRKPISFNGKLRAIFDERVSGLKLLDGERFDLVIDFICYSADDALTLFDRIQTKAYVMISSSWVPRLWLGSDANEISYESQFPNSTLPPQTYRYLLGKLSAEREVVKQRNTGCQATILRMPIVLGPGDHTKRSSFYTNRLLDGNPVVLVDGGVNYFQFAYVDDLARAITKWIFDPHINLYTIWNAIPDTGLQLKNFLNDLSLQLGVEPEFVEIESKLIRKWFPQYLEDEPFSGELCINQTSGNIFKYTGVKGNMTANKSMLRSDADAKFDLIRAKELEFIFERTAHR